MRFFFYILTTFQYFCNFIQNRSCEWLLLLHPGAEQVVRGSHYFPLHAVYIYIDVLGSRLLSAVQLLCWGDLYQSIKYLYQFACA